MTGKRALYRRKPCTKTPCSVLCLVGIYKETDLDLFLEKFQQYEQKIQYVYLPEKGESKKRAVRLYDLDGNMIEVGEVSWQRV